ncbi:MAG TPA: DUF4129 domain-containing protein [Pyrinomonadaceae bacterium]|nr:DUF4129 domain-containing protein [Pyrinomonadaceae bacterium]
MKRPASEFPFRRRLILGLSMVLFAFFVFPGIVCAIPVRDYQKNLQKAITALDTLGPMDEEESPDNFQRRLIATTVAIRSVLPEKQSIESDGSVVEVDNSWLHKRLGEFETSAEPERSTIRTQLIESLKSIEQRVSELEKARATALTKADASKRLGEILSRSEYASQSGKSSALYRLLERFFKWLSQFLPQGSRLSPSHGSPLTAVAQVVVVALAALVIVYVLIKLRRHFKGRSRETNVKKHKEPRIVLGEKLEPEASSSDLLGDAEALARAGEIRAAIRKTYIALLVELGDRKLISLAQHKTNRDYLRSVTGSPTLYQNMRGLTESFERHWYGFAEAAPGDWQDFKAGYLAAIRTSD